MHNSRRMLHFGLTSLGKYRALNSPASKVIGSNVVNDANETIGKIDDLLVSPDGKQPYAVLSIGGFLGMNTHLVVVPYDTLKFTGNKVTLPGGTKEGLKLLPEFKYATG
jgi:PRC-barrel domain protein